MGTILLVFFGGLLVSCIFLVLPKATKIDFFGWIPAILVVVFLVGIIFDPAFIEHRRLLAWATGGLIVGIIVGWWFLPTD